MPSPQVRTAIAGPDSNQVPSHSPSPRRRWIWIVLLWAVVYIPGLFSPPLLDDADSIHAEAARELIVRHDWTTLYIDGVRYLEKAPLMYWGMAASYTVFGTKDWAARLPLALGVLALLLATYSLGKRTLGERAGFRSVLGYGGQLHSFRDQGLGGPIAACARRVGAAAGHLLPGQTDARRTRRFLGDRKSNV